MSILSLLKSPGQFNEKRRFIFESTPESGIWGKISAAHVHGNCYGNFSFLIGSALKRDGKNLRKPYRESKREKDC